MKKTIDINNKNELTWFMSLPLFFFHFLPTDAIFGVRESLALKKSGHGQTKHV